jgi:hypothetical protein
MKTFLLDASVKAERPSVLYPNVGLAKEGFHGQQMFGAPSAPGVKRTTMPAARQLVNSQKSAAQPAGFRSPCLFALPSVPSATIRAHLPAMEDKYEH